MTKLAEEFVDTRTLLNYIQAINDYSIVPRYVVSVNILFIDSLVTAGVLETIVNAYCTPSTLIILIN